MENVHGIILLVFMPAVLVLVRVFGMKLMRYFNNKELEDLTEAKRITQPFFYLLAGVLVSISQVAFFAVFMIVPTVDNENRELPWILLMAFTFGLVFFVGVFIILLRVNWRVEIQEDGFTYRNLFRVTKRYSFDEITERDFGATFRYFKGKKKVLTISKLQPNCCLLSDAFCVWESKKTQDKE